MKANFLIILHTQQRIKVLEMATKDHFSGVWQQMMLIFINKSSLILKELKKEFAT
jgi:hypothetical protein